MKKENFISKFIIGLIAGAVSIVLSIYSLQLVPEGFFGNAILLPFLIIPILILVYAIILVPLSLILYRRLTKK